MRRSLAPSDQSCRARNSPRPSARTRPECRPFGSSARRSAERCTSSTAPCRSWPTQCRTCAPRSRCSRCGRPSKRSEHDPAPLRTQLAAGFRFLWGEPFLRATTLIYGLGNPLAPAILLVIVVFGREQGLSGGEIGILTAALGAATLVGALASPLFRNALTARTILLLELWTWLGLWAFVVWPNVYVLTAALTLFGLAAPVTDSVVVGLRLAITPDRLVGRVESVRMSIALLITPLGPLVAGLLLDSSSAQATVAVFAVLGVFLALCGTLSGSLRSPPSLVAE